MNSACCSHRPPGEALGRCKFRRVPDHASVSDLMYLDYEISIVLEIMDYLCKRQVINYRLEECHVVKILRLSGYQMSAPHVVPVMSDLYDRLKSCSRASLAY